MGIVQPTKLQRCTGGERGEALSGVSASHLLSKGESTAEPMLARHARTAISAARVPGAGPWSPPPRPAATYLQRAAWWPCGHPCGPSSAASLSSSTGPSTRTNASAAQSEGSPATAAAPAPKGLLAKFTGLFDRENTVAGEGYNR